jgi:hypothetical protein
MQKGEYANLRQYLATETEADIGMLIPEHELIPQDENGRVPREHRGQLKQGRLIQ